MVTLITRPRAWETKHPEKFPLSHDSGRQRQTSVKPEGVIAV